MLSKFNKVARVAQVAIIFYSKSEWIITVKVKKDAIIVDALQK